MTPLQLMFVSEYVFLPSPTGPPKPLKHFLVVTVQRELAPVQLVWRVEWDTRTRLLPKCNLRVETPLTRTKCSHWVYRALRDLPDRMSQTCLKCYEVAFRTNTLLLKINGLKINTILLFFAQGTDPAGKHWETHLDDRLATEQQKLKLCKDLPLSL